MPKKTAKKTVKKTAKATKAVKTVKTAKVVKKAVKKAAKKTVKAASLLVRGGKRAGAGRPKGSGKYGCPTKAVRIPSHLAEDVHAFIVRKMKAAK